MKKSTIIILCALFTGVACQKTASKVGLKGFAVEVSAVTTDIFFSPAPGNSGTLVFYARLGSNERFRMSEEGTRATAMLEYTTAGEHALSVEVEYTQRNSTQSLKVAQAVIPVTVADRAVTVVISPEDYVFNFDDDNDAMTNLIEINTEGYHPFDADPIVTSATSAGVPLNTSRVMTIAATSPSSSPLQYAILPGLNSDLFQLDASGELRFIQPPVFENLKNNGEVLSRYPIKVVVSDDKAHHELSIDVAVFDVLFELKIIGSPKQLNFQWPVFGNASHFKLWESLDGLGESYTQLGGDIKNGGYYKDIVVHQYPWATAKYRLEAYDANNVLIGSPTPEVPAASNMLDSIGRFTGVNTKEGDGYATAVAVSKDGKTLAVGAPREDSAATLVNGNAQDDCANPVPAQLNCAADSGAVYIYTRSDTGAWSQQAYIKAPNTDAGDLFGSSVSLSADGNTLAVGAVGEQSTSSTDTANDLGTGVGAVYVYKRGEDQAAVVAWVHTAYIKPQQSALDQVLDTHAFGAGLDLDNNGFNLVIMANGSSRRGYSVSLAATGTAGDTAELANSLLLFTANIQGIAISGDGNTAVIGGSYIYVDNSSVKYRDNIQIYTRNGTNWFTGQNILRPGSSGTQPDNTIDAFGKGLSIDDDGATIAVGAPEDDSNAVGVVGTVSTNNSAIDSGAVYIYNYNVNSESWNATPIYIKAFNTLAGNRFGESVSLSPDGTLLAVGAPLEGSGEIGVFGTTAVAQTAANSSGAVYIYKRDNSSQQNPRWVGSAYVKANQVSKSFGTQCMLSDGALPAQSAPASTLAVGSGEDAFYLY